MARDEEISPDERKITQENCKQLLYEYAEKNYSCEFPSAVGECPYDLSDLDGELAFKGALEWFILERVQPKTGKTILREFVEKFVTEPELRFKMLQMEQVFSGEFRVKRVDGLDAVFACLDTGKEYNVKLLEKSKHLFKVGKIVAGRMHPWGDVHKLCGVTLIKPGEEEVVAKLGIPSPEQMMEWLEKSEIKRADDITVYGKSTVSSLLNKYPFQWVDGICSELGINAKYRKREKINTIVELLHSGLPKILDKLPERSKEALAFVLRQGGVVRYFQLSKRFDDEIGFWWNERPPTSTVGILRSHGLLFVGKMPIGGRIFKVAIVPAELREKLMGMLPEWWKI